MSDCRSYTLNDVVEMYCLAAFNDKRKGFINMMVIAKMVWEEIFLKTYKAMSSEWMPVKKGDPYPFVEIPKNCSRLLSVSYIDDCDRVVPMYISDDYNVILKPKNKKCGCKVDCGCGGLCSATNSFSFETKEVVINDVVYLEKIWKEFCKNGDIVEHREVPTVIYDKDGGSTVGNISNQRRICTLTLRSCGCVEETKENEEKLQSCGCTISSVECQTDLNEPQYKNEKGQIQFSECGTKLFLVGTKNITEMLISFQSSSASEKSDVPREAAKAVMDGIYAVQLAYRRNVGAIEKREARRLYEASKQDLFEFLNPLDEESIYRTQNQKKLW